jgi:cytochrome c biogenesis protein CcmG/thiol:disulfide interchange protein DsbE
VTEDDIKAGLSTPANNGGRRSIPWLYIVPLLVFVALAAIFWIGLGRDPRILPSALLDKPVPQFDLAPLHDANPGLASGDLEGGVTLVNVFASWCLPCRAEHPFLERLAREEGLTIHGINYKDEASAAKAWLAELGNPYSSIGVDRDGRASIDWGVYGVPETFIVDAKGVIRYKHVGPLMEADIAEKILPVVEAISP